MGRERGALTAAEVAVAAVAAVAVAVAAAEEEEAEEVEVWEEQEEEAQAPGEVRPVHPAPTPRRAWWGLVNDTTLLPPHQPRFSPSYLEVNGIL